jgi:hypothetical protein
VQAALRALGVWHRAADYSIPTVRSLSCAVLLNGVVLNT